MGPRGFVAQKRDFCDTAAFEPSLALLSVPPISLPAISVPPISVPPSSVQSSSVHRFPSHHSFFRRNFCLSAYFMFDFDKNRAGSQVPRRESPSLHDALAP
jgi:hypothetical protein